MSTIAPLNLISTYNPLNFPSNNSSITLAQANSLYLSQNGGNIYCSLILGSLTSQVITSNVPLNVVNYCNTNINAMVPSGNPYTPGASSYYINSAGTISSITTSGTFSYSGIFSTDVAANAFINFSDVRIKTNIVNLPESVVDDFINRCEPKMYNLKSNIDNDDFGYIAQNLWKSGFSNIVQLIPDETMEETIDDDGFISPKDIKFTIAYTKIIPILHKKIKMLESRINKLESNQ